MTNQPKMPGEIWVNEDYTEDYDNTFHEENRDDRVSYTRTSTITPPDIVEKMASVLMSCRGNINNDEIVNIEGDIQAALAAYEESRK